MPTRRGRVLLVGAALCYSLARALSVDELFAVAVACLMFPLAATIFVRVRKHGLSLTRAISPRRVFADGAPIRFEVVARNTSRVVSPPLELEDQAPAGLGGPVSLALPPFRPKVGGRATAERVPRLRGSYVVGPMRARLLDPFGLAASTMEVVPRTRIVVYPRIDALPAIAPPAAPGGGGQSPVYKVGRQGDEFYAVRGWQDGDDLRKIHWRSTARNNELMIRQDENKLFPRATMLLDTRGAVHAGDGAASSLEWGVSATASIVWELSRQGYGLRVATTDEAPTGLRWGREAVDPLLSMLALVERSPRRSLEAALRQAANRTGAGGAFVAILPPPEPAALSALARLRKNYDWCGVILLDAASFSRVDLRERANVDRRLADAERALASAGWETTTAGSNDTIRETWQRLLAARARRPRPRSARS